MRINKRKNKTKLYLKKKKFKDFFGKIFVPFLIMASLLGGIVSYLLVSMSDNTVEDRQQNFRKFMIDGEEEAWKDYGYALSGKEEKTVDYDFQIPENAFAGAVEYYCSMARNMVLDEQGATDGVMAIYYRDDNGKVTKIASSERRAYLPIDYADGRYYLSCSVEDNNEMKKKALSSEHNANIHVKDIYVSGNNYWIGTYAYMDGTDEIIATNDNIPEGYVKVESSKLSKAYPEFYGSEADMDKCEDIEELIESISTVTMEGASVDRSYDCDFGKHTIYVQNLGNEYYMIADFHTNFWKSLYGKLVIGTWVGIIFLSVILSLAMAYAMYKSYMAAYEMEQYRRTTSNAMAHDLKSPLSVILLNAENLRDETKPEKNKDYMDNIIDEVHLMNDQIASILDMAKAEDVNIRLNKTDVDVTDIVNTLIEKLGDRIAEKNVSVEVQGTCKVRADEKLMKQAISNIMDNAVKYVTEAGEIKIWLSDSEVIIENSSEHIDEKVLADIWNPFVKADDSRHGHRGTGLGLSIVKVIMERHGFDCTMENIQRGVKVALVFNH